MSPTSKISRWWLPAVLGIICPAAAAWAQPPATRPASLSHIQIDARKKQIRVQCIEVNAQMPLEFFCVMDGGPEHETVLRTAVRPSEIHFGLLALGFTPGEPAHFVEATNTWYAPTGPPLKITCEFERDGQPQTVPAERMMRSMKTKQPMPAATWVFDGSRILPDGQYAADITGYVVSIVNFDLTMIDVPQLASNSNETLEWECNPEVCPKKGAAVTMIIEPAPAGSATRPAQSRPADQFNPGPGLHAEVSGAASRP